MGSNGMPKWMQYMELLDKSKKMPIKCTIDKYNEIRGLELETIVFESYGANRLNTSLIEVRKFVEQNEPCLFIYDAIVPNLHKGALFDVIDYKQIVQWIMSNSDDVHGYNYLITSQISNPGDGFVGSVYSNGRGKMYCETLHDPNVCNQRELTQPSKTYEGLINELYIDATHINETWSVYGKFLSRRDVLDLKDMYINRSGYFEFVKGVQHGDLGIFTVGYETGGIFTFPEEIHKNGFIDITCRLNGTLLKDGMK
jgi:hypothetical protein